MSGAASYRKGRAGEYLCQAHLNGLGWYVTRAYASAGPWDLLAMRAGDWALMVQVRVSERKPTALSNMLPEERERLWALAVKAGAQAIIAVVPNPYGVLVERVTYARMEGSPHRLVPYEPT